MHVAAIMHPLARRHQQEKGGRGRSPSDSRSRSPAPRHSGSFQHVWAPDAELASSDLVTMPFCAGLAARISTKSGNRVVKAHEQFGKSAWEGLWQPCHLRHLSPSQLPCQGRSLQPLLTRWPRVFSKGDLDSLDLARVGPLLYRSPASMCQAGVANDHEQELYAAARPKHFRSTLSRHRMVPLLILMLS